MADLTYGKLRRDITAIVERLHPVPRGEDCLPVSEMEKALVDYAHELVLTAYADASRLMEQMRADHKQQIEQAEASHENTRRRLQKRLDDAEKRAATEAELRRGAELKLFKVRTVRCWTNEDGKRFVFADDLVAATDPDLIERRERG